MRFKFLFCVILMLVFFAGSAQELQEQPEMITDRPDQTESSSLVPQGYLQVETGIFYESFEEALVQTRVTGYNTSLLRYGLLQNLEIRLGIDVQETNFEFQNQEFGRQETGFSPLLLGAKIGIAEENGILPEMAFLGHMYLPFTASSQYKPETTGVDFRFAFSHTLSEKSGLAYNIGARWREDNPEAIYLFTLSYAYALTENLGLFAEYYSDFPENGTAIHSLDGGITYSIKPNIQLDAYAGKGITDDSYFLLGAGISYRIPN